MSPSGASDFGRAIALVNAGRRQEAEAALRSIVSRDPASAQGWYLLGSLLSLEGRQVESRASLERAVALAPNLRPAWLVLAQVGMETGDLGLAESSFRRALAIDAADADAWSGLAAVLHSQARLDETIDAYRRALAIAPGLAGVHNDLANALAQHGHAGEALQHYATSLRLAPDVPDVVANFGMVLLEAGRASEALPQLERAALLKPDSVEVLHRLGVAYSKLGRDETALEWLRKALDRDPHRESARFALGSSLMSLARWAEAERCFVEVLANLGAGLADRELAAHTLSNLALTLAELGRPDEAVAACERALELRPGHEAALINAGVILHEEGRYAESMAFNRRAVEANPASARAAYYLGMDHLYRFEFEQGWALLNQRFRTNAPFAVARTLGLPRFEAGDWDRYRHLAVWKEQGIGDQLLFSTMLPELAARRLPFTLEVDGRLAAAFARTYPDWSIVPAGDADAAFAKCDCQISIASLPALFRPSVESFRAQPRQLLRPDESRAMEMGAYAKEAGVRLVGVSWRSFQSRVRVREHKSAPLLALRRLSLLEQVRLLDLQYGDTQAERLGFEKAGGRLARIEGLDLFNDLDGLMAAIHACDLVITTSNATAHLAGVMGKETWLVYLKDRPPFYYWVPGQDGRSLWYPSIEIVTDPAWTTWEEGFEGVARRLQARFEARA